MAISPLAGSNVHPANPMRTDIGTSSVPSPAQRPAATPGHELGGLAPRSRRTPDANPAALPPRQAEPPAAPSPSLIGLPTDVLRDIADRLDNRGAKALALTSKSMLESTRNVVAKKDLLGRLDHLPDALRQAALIPPSEAGARTEVLKGIAQKADLSPQRGTLEFVHEFVRALAPLHPAQQATVLEALASRAQDSPSADPAVAASLLQAIDALPPEQRSAPLAALTLSYAKLETDRMPLLLELVQRSVERLKGHPAAAQPLKALAQAWTGLDSPTASRPQEQRDQPGGDLVAEQGARVRLEARMRLETASRMGFDFIAGQIEHLPEAAQAQPLAGLAQLVNQVPFDTALRFRHVFDAIGKLPPGDREDPLVNLASQVKDSPPEWSASAIGSLVQMLDRQPVASWFKLAECLQNLPETERPQHSRLAAIVGPRITDELIRQIPLGQGGLPAEWKTLSRTIAPTIEQLPPEAFQAVAARFEQMSAEQRTQCAPVMYAVYTRTMNDLLGAIEKLPPEQRAAPLAECAHRVSRLPALPRQQQLDRMIGLCESIPDLLLAKPLQAVTQQISKCLPDVALDNSWRSAMRLAERARREDLPVLLHTLTQQIPRLTAAGRAEARTARLLAPRSATPPPAQPTPSPSWFSSLWGGSGR